MDRDVKVSINSDRFIFLDDSMFTDLYILLNSVDCLITDYSSVFFDFSYLKKPVIYYRGEDEYHYEQGYFDFETMGFGDIITSEEVLIDKINE